MAIAVIGVAAVLIALGVLAGPGFVVVQPNESPVLILSVASGDARRDARLEAVANYAARPVSCGALTTTYWGRGADAGSDVSLVEKRTP